jgi:hypothetical protein
MIDSWEIDFLSFQALDFLPKLRIGCLLGFIVIIVTIIICRCKRILPAKHSDCNGTYQNCNRVKALSHERELCFHSPTLSQLEEAPISPNLFIHISNTRNVSTFVLARGPTACDNLDDS